MFNEDEFNNLEDIFPDGPGNSSINLNININKLNECDFSENIIFTSIFAYTLSRFVGSEKVLFDIVNDDLKEMPILVDCKNQYISSFMSNVVESIEYSYKNQKESNANIVFNLKTKEINSYDFNTTLIKKNNDYTLNISFSEKYSKSTIERFLNTFKLIAQDILNLKELNEITYITSSDLNLLNSYNETEHPLKYRDILDAFNDNLSKYPNNNLVSFNDKIYTYSEGAFVANEISQKLKALGIKPKDSVGFLTERSESYYFNVLSILSIGAVYVPLDEALPDERIEFILSDSNVKVLIVSDSTYERSVNLISNDIIILNISDILKEDIGTLSRLPIVYGDVACILYTSGTTGVPKGVKITRKSILNISQYYEDTYGISNNDIYGLYAAIGFDAGTLALGQCIYSGSCLSIIPENIKLNIHELNNYFIKQGITHTMMTTQIGKLFMENVENDSLKVLLVGGEKLGEYKNTNNFQLVDGFGPTETFSFVTSIDNSDKLDPSSIGKLNYNTKAYVLDNELRRVPIGAVGELCISGYQVAAGYLNREDENLKSFISNPFDNNVEYNVLYRTGDIVRVLPDGSFAIVGRRDSQVKIRGNRVELSEIESVIREINYVKDITVQTIKHGDNYELVAYVVPTIKIDNLNEVISRYVAISKPDYMIPSYVIELDSIPLTVNGKIDKNALPKVDLSSLHTKYVAPTTQKEKIIVNAFEDVFNLDKIGLNDDFINIGGDSISAIRVVAFLQKQGISCNTRDILNYKTPYSIAQNIQETNEVSYDNIEGEVDLLPIQRFFFEEINSNEFSQEYILKSKIDLDINLFQKAFDEVSKVHDMLRATYRFDENNIVQEILPINTRVCEINEIYLENEDFNTEIPRILYESNKSLDIGNDLIKINLVHYKGTSYVIFVIHHLIIDGISWSILIDDLTYYYTLFLENKEGILTTPYPYKTWVENVKELALNISEKEKQHWKEVNNLLDDSKIKGKVHGFAFKADTKFDADNLFMLSEEEFLALSIARSYKKTYDEDIIFNKESYGRDESLGNVNRTIGWFTTQFPVPVKVNNSYDNISLIKDIYALKVAFKDVEHLGMNYGSLVFDSKELEFKHSPVTLNFLSHEFVFKNEIFQSLDEYLCSENKIDLRMFKTTVYGITLNISHVGENYIISGTYAENTYLGDKFDEFVENIKYEMDFISNYKLEENIVCCLSEAQMGIYLDEKVREMGTAYSTHDIFKCPPDKSVEDIKNALNILVEKHPILKGRIVDGDIPLYICDSEPVIEVAKPSDYSDLIKPFDLDKNLARFYIIPNKEYSSIFFDIHHIIGDGTNRQLLFEELSNIFKGDYDDAIDLGFVYESNANFNAKFEDIYKEANEFYMDNLSDIDEVNPLLPVIGESHDRVRLPIRGIKNNIKKFAHEIGITVGNLLNAVFAYTYSRFTGSNKVFYTYTQHGRHQHYAQKAFGMFARTTPLIIDCSDTSVEDYLIKVSDLIMDSMQHSIYPYRLLANEFDLSFNNAFEYNYNLNDVSDVGDEIIIEDMDMDLISDFICVVNDLEDGFLVRIDSTDKYSDEFIIRFLNVFKEVLIQILEKSNLSDIDYISNSDLELLESYNMTEHSLEYEDILDAFNDNLSSYPNNKLVTFNETNYSYSEGAYIANEIATCLKKLDVKTQDNVAFLVERSEYYMFCILGILSIGGVYVPLDDDLPDERIRFMINDTESHVIIASDGTFERAKELSNGSIILNISEIINNDIGNLSSLPVTYGDLACLLYTSGSTGIPKGVKVTRKSILNVSAYYADAYNLTNDDVFGMFASIGFDAGSHAILTTIYAGASLSIVPMDIRLDMIKLNDYFIKQGVTQTFITTQVGKLFAQTNEHTSLNVLVVGGEKLGDFKSPENYDLIDIYGPTEAFVFVASSNNSNKIDSSSVGNLIYNTKSYILDDEFRPVPIGAVGELYLAGHQIANGYLNNIEEQLNSFIDNPFESSDNYNLMYRTGDMARILSDGTLAIVGRRDKQVKIRGNRVELSEVESVIREIDYINDVSVQTVQHDTNNEIVAYVVVNKNIGENELKDSISNYVSERKPSYMVPTFIIELNKIPLNVNGKVDKRALPKVDINSLHTEYVPPTTETEKLIVEAFEKTFNREKISIHDDFIQLGGDSLIAIKLLTYLEDYDITAGDILSLGTPFAIGKNIKKDSFDLEMYSLNQGCPLNEPQLNIYLDIIANNKVDSYLVPVVVRISKEYNINNICEALNEMFDVHPILTMCINTDNEIPYLLKSNKPPIDVKNNASKEDIVEFLTESFNFDENLSRFLIVENDKGFSLFSVFHHIIFDGISELVFKQDLEKILNGETIKLDDSFLKVSSFNQQIKKINEFEEAKEFYDRMLVDSDEINELPCDVYRNRSGIYRDDLNIDLDLLKEFLSTHKLSENALFTSVFAYTLSRFTGDNKVLFNIIENGRTRFNNFNSIGMFVNTLPMLVDCKNQETNCFVNDVSDLLYDVMRYNYYPFRILANEYDINSNILFQYMPSWVSDFGTYEKYIDEILDEMRANQEDMIGEFVGIVSQNKDGHSISIQYCDKYSQEMVKRFINSFKLILSDIISVDKLEDIDYISEEDLEILDNINQNDNDLRYSDILDAFNDVLSEYPNNNLISANGNMYTYSEGAFIANKIAEKLIDLEVKPQECISFLIDYSELYLLAPLAIISIGGIYVPLDILHPDDRLNFIVKDTNSKVIIVTDETYERASRIFTDCTILNVSEILKGDIKTLSTLPVTYGDLACLLYTSGSTGVPKGVKITRKSILNIAEYYIEKYEFNKEDVYGSYASIGFDIASFGIFTTLYTGACLSIIPKDIRLNMQQLNQYYTEHNITHTFMTTQVAKQFIEHTEKTSLKYLLTGGEKLGNFKRKIDYTLIDVYGPTESFTFTHTIDVKEKIDFSSVGFLNHNVKAYILDDEKRHVPFGAIGELYLSGYQVAEGYLNRKEENVKSFFKNPFENDENYSTMYRTGDIVRYLPDKSIGIVGRRDKQVKIRGNRVELPEVENIIRQLDYVKDITVQTVKNGTNNELVAYVVLAKEIDDLRDSIRNYVLVHKPYYMAPSYVVELDEIPLNINAKVDKKKLPPITFDDSQEYEAPETPLEKAVAKGFEEVLSISRPVGLNDEFAQLGGDSISIMMLISKLRDVNLHITVKDIVENQSVRKIAEKVEYKKFSNEISQNAFEGCVETTPIVQHFWDSNFKNPSYFNHAFLFEASKRIDIDILKKAMQAIINHHDILRAKVKDSKLFVEPIDGEYFTIETCHSLDYARETLRLNQQIDIFNGPLIKLAIFSEEDCDNLYIVIHHLLVDGVSWRIIIDDLNLAYAQLSNNLEINLPAKTSSYADYAIAINRYRNNEELLKQKNYWENTLTALRNGKHTTLDSNIRKMEDISIKFPKDISLILLTNAPINYNSSINAIFLSAISKAWKNITGDDEFSLRLEGHGREEFDDNILIDRTVGWFTTCYPVIIKCEGETNSEIIGNIEKSLNDVPQKGFGYPPLMGIENDEIPLITFNYLGEMNTIKTGEMFIIKNRPDLASAFPLENDYGSDININGYTLNNEIHFKIDFNSERFSRETLLKFIEEFKKSIDGITKFIHENDFSEDIKIFSTHPNKKNLFLIHSANFGSEFFYYIAQQLKDDYSLAVIEPYNINHKENQLTSIEEFASKYIEIIKSIQPEGPYYIGGFCFGGVIAHEIAIQLKKQNEKVEKLILFDAHNIQDKDLQKLIIEDQILHAREYLIDGMYNPKNHNVEYMIAYATLSVNIWLNYKPPYYDGDVLYVRANIKPQGDISDTIRKTYEYIFDRKAAGFEECYNNEKLKIIKVPAEHNDIFNTKSIEIIVPAVKKFIGL